MQRFARSLGLVAVLAVVVGCSGSTSVRPFGGTYDLASVEGRNLPQRLVPGNDAPELLGGTLNVGADSLDVTVSLQYFDGAGHPIGGPAPTAFDFPYARLGDSLYLASDTSALHDPLYTGPPPVAIGAILGSSVRMTLLFVVPTSTGFGYVSRRLLFTPAE